MTETQLINLSAEDILSLIRERPIQKDGLCISSKASFLTILALLDDELTQSLSDDRISAP